jgi:N-acetylneuraminate synthase
MSEHIYMIAEVGLNHNADMQIAKRLIDATFACGWDCVKFQKRNPDKCVPENQKNVPRTTPWGAMTYLEYKHKMEFGKKEYDYIDHYCKEKPVAWTASVWDSDSLDFINKYDIPFIKIPSAMVTNTELVKSIVGTGKRVIMSTGMSTEVEIDKAVTILDTYSDNYCLMHTNSTYPTPLPELNLGIIPYLKERYKCTVGYGRPDCRKAHHVRSYHVGDRPGSKS